MEQVQELINNCMGNFKQEMTGTIESLKVENKELKDNKYKLEVNKLLLESKSLDTGFFDFVFNEDIEVVKSNIETLESLLTVKVDKLVNERLNNGYKPPKDENNLVNHFKKPKYMV